MKWNDRFHEVIEYIEICLQQYHEDISVKDIESIMDCSYDLFQKMFRTPVTSTGNVYFTLILHITVLLFIKIITLHSLCVIYHRTTH